jgi:2-hydroxychromene-2-carboxylate isomerase
MGTTSDALEFWFEFASTYSYLAAARVEALARAAGVTLHWRPFLLGPIFARQGWNDSPFNVYPAKGRYMWRDMERRCAGYGIPFRRPTQFPRNGLLAARVTCLASGKPWCPEFVRRAYRANFAEDLDIGEARTITAILDAMGLAGADLVTRAHAPEIKERLRRQTERAVALGIFGAPTFVAAGELFWGDDRLDDAIGWLLRREATPETGHARSRPACGRTAKSPSAARPRKAAQRGRNDS